MLLKLLEHRTPSGAVESESLDQGQPAPPPMQGPVQFVSDPQLTVAGMSRPLQFAFLFWQPPFCQRPLNFGRRRDTAAPRLRWYGFVAYRASRWPADGRPDDRKRNPLMR